MSLLHRSGMISFVDPQIESDLKVMYELEEQLAEKYPKDPAWMDLYPRYLEMSTLLLGDNTPRFLLDIKRRKLEEIVYSEDYDEYTRFFGTPLFSVRTLSQPVKVPLREVTQ